MNSFGQYLRSLRLQRKLLLREVSADLGVDPSLLSRIEGDLKRCTREQVIRLAKILKASETEMLIHYLSDRVVYELKDEGLAMEAMKAAERKMRYMRRTDGKRR